MRCQELVELVTDYFDGALPEAVRRDLDAHLAECDDCTHYVEQMRETISLVSSQTSGEVPPDTVEQLMQTFRRLTSGSAP